MPGTRAARLKKIHASAMELHNVAYGKYINLLSDDEITSELEAFVAAKAAKPPGLGTNWLEPMTTIVRKDLWRKVIADMLNGGG